MTGMIAPHKIGPSLYELADLVKERINGLKWLLNPPFPTKGAGILGDWLAKDSAAHAARHAKYGTITPELAATPAYKWISKNEHYQAACNALSLNVEMAEKHSISEAIRTLEFVEAVARHVGLHVLTPGWVPRIARKRDKKNAAYHIEELLKLFQLGVRLDDFTEHSQLDAFLRKLQTELQAPAKGAYSGKVKQRWELTFLSASLLHDFSMSDTVDAVKALAPLMGYDPDRRTVQRYVKSAADKNDKFVEKVMPGLGKRSATQKRK